MYKLSPYIPPQDCNPNAQLKKAVDALHKECAGYPDMKLLPDGVQYKNHWGVRAYIDTEYDLSIKYYITSVVVFRVDISYQSNMYEALSMLGRLIEDEGAKKL